MGVIFILIVIINIISGYLTLSFIGAIVDLCFGVVTAVLITGVVYLLLSINENLLKVSDAIESKGLVSVDELK